MLKRMLILAGAVAAAAAICGPAVAQSKFPDHPVKLVVPFPPGGGADILARLVGQKLNERWGQPVVVESKPGNAGIVGSNEVGRSKPDGYTLVMAASGAIVASNINQLTPIALVSTPPYMLAVHDSMPVKTVQEFIAYLKQNPGKVNFGSSGIGSASHLAADLFMRMTGTEMVHVPYKGIGQAINDLVGNKVSVMFGPPQALLPQAEAKTVKILGITSKTKSKVFPDLPTVAETVPGYEAVGWYGVLGPNGIPDPVVTEISAGVNAALADPVIAERLTAMGAAATPGTPGDFKAFLDADIAKWNALLEKLPK
ncbi:Bug family tripartite tricarboxylate transporter substrate binding protein [Xanthobacter tagetidis]|jgi:tripartite-type tricarboxylate transporter receptor subunit TctC|uniref:Tripartite tricarboxylate transporter substrate binding protein n=1 Tax=Xanthobacter tagetidis TaxID=60216 RepID=A0A3L7A6B8_9HYPH|nr:tripartite tricarboxylate transporter substrate binding protein [Xanthobacter tagetidis]MBB6310007.1 tripartite-type tricarboxylate transporter receptor subunit TctC [Xanthobacter tagetidis]RLP75111.1 tripartite tricarboxylate transporter substrate binding protein [Xanthobacter tagetidis]